MNPNSSLKLYRSFNFLLASLIFCVMLDSASQLNAAEKDSYSGISFLNRYPLVEPAFSRGSFGASFGISTAFQSIKDLSEYEQFHLDPYEKSESVTESRIQSKAISFTKGSNYPIDFGLHLRQLSLYGATSAGTHMQFNMFEAFKLPSLSLRIAFQKTFGIYALEAKSIEVQLLSSYALLSNLIFTTGISVSKNQYRADYSKSNSYALQSESDTNQESISSQVSVLSIGTKWMILAPNLSITGELAGLAQRLNTYSTQIILQLEI